jgi:hypothetical protein
MSNLTYASWPFRSPGALPPDEAARWWELCYYEPDVARMAAGWSHWRVILGGPGSGKSVLLAALETAELVEGRSFVVRYPPSRWPGALHALVEDGNHLAQIMAAIALRLRDYLGNVPAEVARLTAGQRTVLRWMMNDYLGRRAFDRWADGLPDEAARSLQAVPYEQLYTSTTQPLEVVGQIDEAVNLIKRLGFQRIVLSADVNSREAPMQLSALGELFSWLELMQQPGLAMMAAVPRAAAEEVDLVARARGRVNFARLDWEIDRVRAMTEKCLRAALNDQSVRLDQLITPEALKELSERLAAEYGETSPQGWVWLTETLLHCGSSDPAGLPVGVDSADRLWRDLCARYFPLELIVGRGVWRGPRFISIDPQPLKLLELIWHSNEPVNIDSPGWQAVQGAATNPKSLLHTLARRLRQAIEPDPSHPIYLISDRGEGGYWLDNIVRPVAAM